jgi:hypothetical protein
LDFYNSKRENNYQTNCHPLNAEYGKNKTVHPRHSALLLEEKNGEKDMIT